MKLSIFILASLAIAGCEKSSNVNALQDETNGIAHHYTERFDELQHRVSMIEARGRTMTGNIPGMLDVQKLYVSTAKQLRELTGAVKEAPKSISNAAKSEHAREDLIKLKAELEHRFEKGDIEVTTNLDEIETWMSYVPYRPRVEPPPPAPEPTNEPPAPDDHSADKQPEPTHQPVTDPAPAAGSNGASPPGREPGTDGH